MTNTRSHSAAFLTLLLALFLCAEARGQDDLNLSVNAIPPHVMILADNSGSMAQAFWHDDFDPEVFQDSAAVLLACDIGPVPAIVASDGFCPGSGDATFRCPDNEDFIAAGPKGVVSCAQAAIPGGCAAAPPGWLCKAKGLDYVFTVPDFTSGTRTRWSTNYLSWIFTQILAGTTPVTPLIDRMDLMRAVLLNLIDLINPDGFNENVLFGLSTFDGGNDPDGGSIKTPVSSGNKTALRAGINGLGPGGFTPLAETLVEIGEYLSGDNDIAACTKAGTPGNAPMDDWCRKNFVIVLTDGGPTKDDFNHNPGTAEFVCEIGNSDSDADESPDEFSGRTDAPPYQDLGTDWLDDVAHYFFENDMRPDAAHPDLQNIVTYTVGFTIDHPLLRDTAANSTGRYFTADDPAELAQALHAAVVEIIERSTSFTAATVPSSRTAFTDGFYSAYFIPRLEDPTWEGHLEAYRLSSTLGVVDKDGNPALEASGKFIEPRNPFWDLGLRLLDAGHPTRKLYTTLGGAQTDYDTASIAAADLGVVATDLNLYPNDPNVPFADEEALTDAIVDYMWGQDAFDDDRDTDTTELRDWVLGDIFHSKPVVIASPPFFLSHEDGFGPPDTAGTFLDLYLKRDRRLYVGANDGILHGVEAGSFQPGDNPATPETEDGYYDMGSGNEEFGYVPGVLLDTVKFVPRNGIPRSYYYVDGSPSAADAWFPSSAADTDKDGSEWATVLITGMRQGGPGYLALDVTDPSASLRPYPKLLWEFDDPAEPMGQSWSQPVITRVKVEAAAGFTDHCGPDDGEGDCREQWVAIVGGGFLNTGDPNLITYISDPNDPAWSDDSKSVFIIALDTGKVLAKLAYDAADAQLQNMLYAIPSTPAVLDLDFDGFADVIYIGDSGGQLWKWDIKAVGRDADSDGLVDVDPASWPAGVFFRSAPEDVGGGLLHYRSIFFPPSAAFVDGELTLAFGTGERTDLPYLGTGAKDENNRFYVIQDLDPTGLGSIPAAAYTEADIDDITLLPTDPDPNNLGFYLVVADGEKFITNHVIFAGFAITASYVPADPAGGICTAAGESFVYVFDLLSGSGFFDVASGADSEGRRLFAGVGVPADPQISVGPGGTKLFLQTSTGAIIGIDAPDPGQAPVEMVYWKQDF